jgi:hypothetical protein
MPPEPTLVLWAWERPEHLEFVDPRRTAVAFLAETIALSADEVIATPRRQPLHVPRDTTLIAVVRVETQRSRPASLQTAQRNDAVANVLDVVARTGVRALQIDFDATLRERGFYRALLRDLRSGLPAGTGLSITALASWCLDDPWISDLPVDAAIPMLFRMGPEGLAIRHRIGRGESFSVALCRSDLGVSMDEPRPSRAARRWVFNPRPWSRADLERIRSN